GAAFIDLNRCRDVNGIQFNRIEKLGLGKHAPAPDDVFTDFGRFIEAVKHYYATVLGSASWVQIHSSDAGPVEALLQALAASLDQASPSGSRISSSEKNMILQMALPGNISLADVNNLIDRFDALALGALPAEQTKIGEAADEVEQVAAELESR